MIKKILLATMIAASLCTTAIPASAAVQVYIETAPPPLRAEPVPRPRHGYVWVPGYWGAHGHKYVWTHGSWVKEKKGYHYHSPQWVESNGRWSMEQGRWARADSDHDGVPNGVDRQPENPRKN